ncbi:MAG: hypothetical protein Q9179_004679 [Wetmoreana sp. 5 TL-2023]
MTVSAGFLCLPRRLWGWGYDIDVITSKAPPEPWPIPAFEPLPLSGAPTDGEGSLPDGVNPDDPYAIFKLFFTDNILLALIKNTNEFAELHPGFGLKNKGARRWRSTNVEELRAYIATYIWAGLFVKGDTKELWNKDPMEGPQHSIVTKYIGKNRWQQLDQYFHISTREAVRPHY